MPPLLPSLGQLPLHFTHPEELQYLPGKNIKLEADVPSIQSPKVTSSIKGAADKHSHIEISETAVLFPLLFISAVVIAVASPGPVSVSQINALASSMWVQPRPLSLTKLAYFKQR